MAPVAMPPPCAQLLMPGTRKPKTKILIAHPKIWLYRALTSAPLIAESVGGAAAYFDEQSKFTTRQEPYNINYGIDKSIYCENNIRRVNINIILGGVKMPGVKTAISLEENLFNQVNKLANNMHVSRSKLFTLAVKDYLKKQESKKLLAQLNAAYGDSPSEEEKSISEAMHRKQRKILEQESW